MIFLNRIMSPALPRIVFATAFFLPCVPASGFDDLTAEIRALRREVMSVKSMFLQHRATEAALLDCISASADTKRTKRRRCAKCSNGSSKSNGKRKRRRLSHEIGGGRVLPGSSALRRHDVGDQDHYSSFPRPGEDGESTWKNPLAPLLQDMLLARRRELAARDPVGRTELETMTAEIFSAEKHEGRRSGSSSILTPKERDILSLGDGQFYDDGSVSSLPDGRKQQSWAGGRKTVTDRDKNLLLYERDLADGPVPVDARCPLTREMSTQCWTDRCGRALPDDEAFLPSDWHPLTEPHECELLRATQAVAEGKAAPIPFGPYRGKPPSPLEGGLSDHTGAEENHDSNSPGGAVAPRAPPTPVKRAADVCARFLFGHDSIEALLLHFSSGLVSQSPENGKDGTISANMTFLEIGSHEGGDLEFYNRTLFASLRASSLGRRARVPRNNIAVVAFEPLAEHAADLRRRFPEVKVVQAAVAGAAEIVPVKTVSAGGEKFMRISWDGLELARRRWGEGQGGERCDATLFTRSGSVGESDGDPDSHVDTGEDEDQSEDDAFAFRDAPVDTASELVRVMSIEEILNREDLVGNHVPIVLSINCEGCEYGLMYDFVRSDHFHRKNVRWINISWHSRGPDDRISIRCSVEDRLWARGYRKRFYSYFGWEGWELLDEHGREAHE